jgi:hypothetical protein
MNWLIICINPRLSAVNKEERDLFDGVKREGAIAY